MYDDIGFMLVVYTGVIYVIFSLVYTTIDIAIKLLDELTDDK